MGDPKKAKKRYKTPYHPWSKPKIELEKSLLKEYGLRNKKEVWKMESLLRNFKDQAKRLNALSTDQAEKESELLLQKLKSLGIIEETSQLSDILNLDIRDVLERRLQTIVYKKHLARSITQARQFITHCHIMVEDKKITMPSFLVRKKQENKITFSDYSTLASPDHPERIITEKAEKPKKKEVKDKRSDRKGTTKRSEVKHKGKPKKEEKKEDKKGSKEEKKQEKSKDQKEKQEE